MKKLYNYLLYDLVAFSEVLMTFSCLETKGAFSFDFRALALFVCASENVFKLKIASNKNMILKNKVFPL